MPSLARRSSPAAADQSHTPYSPPPLLPSPPVLALTCWARCGAGFAQLYSTCGLLTWALAHVGGAPPTPISRPRSAVAVDHPVQGPVQDSVQKIPCEIPCKRSRARSIANPPPPPHLPPPRRRPSPPPPSVGRRRPSPPLAISTTATSRCAAAPQSTPAMSPPSPPPRSPLSCCCCCCIYSFILSKCFSDLSCQIQSHYPRFFLCAPKLLRGAPSS